MSDTQNRRLNPALLGQLPSTVSVPRYDRSKIGQAIAHIGRGNTGRHIGRIAHDRRDNPRAVRRSAHRVDRPDAVAELTHPGAVVVGRGVRQRTHRHALNPRLARVLFTLHFERRLVRRGVLPRHRNRSAVAQVQGLEIPELVC